MKSRIGIAGPNDLVTKVLTQAKTRSEELANENINLLDLAELIPMVYKSESEIYSIVKQNEPSIDVLLCVDPLSYQLITHYPLFNKPIFLIRYSGSALYKVLAEQAVRGDSWSGASFDSLPQKEVEESFQEIGLKKDLFFAPNIELNRVEGLVQYHMNLLKSGKANLAMTCIQLVEASLKEKKYDVYRVTPTVEAINTALEQIENYIKHEKLVQSQLSIGFLIIEELTQGQRPQEEKERSREIINKILKEFSRKTQATTQWVNDSMVQIVTTKGVVENGILVHKKPEILAELHRQLKWTGKMGIGLGRTANETMQNAKKALNYSLKKSGPQCYILQEEGQLIGPLGGSQQLHYSHRELDQDTIQAARKAGLSVASINRIFSLLDSIGTKNVSASDLADGLEITLRSARRLLKTLEDAGLARVVGEEQPVGRGRPRQVYAIQKN